jgi:hypothetical protein
LAPSGDYFEIALHNGEAMKILHRYLAIVVLLFSFAGCDAEKPKFTRQALIDRAVATLPPEASTWSEEKKQRFCELSADCRIYLFAHYPDDYAVTEEYLDSRLNLRFRDEDKWRKTFPGRTVYYARNTAQRRERYKELPFNTQLLIEALQSEQDHSLGLHETYHASINWVASEFPHELAAIAACASIQEDKTHPHAALEEWLKTMDGFEKPFIEAHKIVDEYLAGRTLNAIEVAASKARGKIIAAAAENLENMGAYFDTLVWRRLTEKQHSLERQAAKTSPPITDSKIFPTAERERIAETTIFGHPGLHPRPEFRVEIRNSPRPPRAIP